MRTMNKQMRADTQVEATHCRRQATFGKVKTTRALWWTLARRRQGQKPCTPPQYGSVPNRDNGGGGGGSGAGYIRSEVDSAESAPSRVWLDKSLRARKGKQ